MRSIGIDIVEIDRMRADVEKYGERFLSRILSAKELELYHSRIDKEQFLAGRFAAKEAIIKALGVFLEEKPLLNSITILNVEKGQPVVEFSDEVNASLTGASCLISISHERNYAAAVAAFVEDK